MGKIRREKPPWTVKAVFGAGSIKPLPRPAPGLGAYQKARIHAGLGTVPQV